MSYWRRTYGRTLSTRSLTRGNTESTSKSTRERRKSVSWRDSSWPSTTSLRTKSVSRLIANSHSADISDGAKNSSRSSTLPVIAAPFSWVPHDVGAVSTSAG